MKLLHFLIIIIPIAISLTIIVFYVIPSTIPVQPLRATVVGYSVVQCYKDPQSKIPVCANTIPTIVGNNSYILHERDNFTLLIAIDNPNSFPIDNISENTTFDRNAINYHFSGCGCCMIHTAVEGFGSSSPILIPLDRCEIFIANSSGTANATVNLQYEINKMPHSVSASQIITILPKN